MAPLVRSSLISLVCAGVTVGCSKVDACSADVKKEVASPDGRWKAVVFNRSCGVLSSPQTGVSILEPSHVPGSEYPNVFDVTHSVLLRPEEIDAVLDSVSVAWTSDSSISIEYDARTTILYQVARLWGLVVTYKEVTREPH